MVTVTTNRLTVTSRGGPDAVIVEGDIVNPDGAPEAGFLLHDVSGVVLEGFTVQGFHESDIIVRGGSHNTIRQNKTTKSAHDGIQLQASSGNLVERNVSFNNVAGPPAGHAFTDACGILLFEGAAENVIRRNEVFGNAFGILIARAGPGNVIDRNDSRDNRRYGIRNNITDGTLIDRNEVVHNRVTDLGPGKGITVEGGSTSVVVTRNAAFDNTPDLFWDQLGSAEFSRNTCATSQPTGLCQGG
jgi:parallel beta-helix repeat protein